MKRITETRTTTYKEAVNVWESENQVNTRDITTKPKSPQPATFENVKVEYTTLLQDYTITSNIYKTRSELQSRFLSWLTKTVDSDIWTAIITTL